MDKVFLDTDVCLDFLAVRHPFYQSSKEVIMLDQYKNEIMISEGCIPNLIYILSNTYKLDNSTHLLIRFIASLAIASSEKSVILRSLRSGFKDKEDSYQYHTALHNHVDYFITRNKKDFLPFATAIPVYTPTEFLEIYE